MTDSVKLLGPSINFAIVQLPGRRYPGVVVQGDTLENLVRQIEKMSLLLNDREFDELGDTLDLIHDQLSDALSYYHKICADNSIS
jgi:hypothetical protein